MRRAGPERIYASKHVLGPSDLIRAVLYWLGLSLLMIYGLFGGSLPPAASAWMTTAIFAAGAGYSAITFKWSADRFQAAGWRGWWFGPPIFLPHSWWAIVTVVWFGLAVFAVSMALSS